MTPPAKARDVEWLMLVDRFGNTTGRELRHTCHALGLRHRAFSVLLWDPAGRCLLQRRSKEKPLWPGAWSNACCSHPRWGESLDQAVARRLIEELKCSAQVRLTGSLLYHARFEGIGTEHEFTHIFCGEVSKVEPDPKEVEDTRFVAANKLSMWMEAQPQDFTPWFRRIWKSSVLHARR